MFPTYWLQVFLTGKWERLSTASTPDGLKRMTEHLDGLREGTATGTRFRIVRLSHLADGEPEVVA